MKEASGAIPPLPQRYRLVRRVGVGGMATVVLVEDLSAEPSAKVLKILRPDLPKQVVAGFKKEFRILASLDHPGLARVFEFGELPGGQPYYTAELVEGDELGRSSPAPGFRDVCLSIASACRALAYLHTRGYLHNDVKPANILVPGGSPSEATLLDLGLVTGERGRGRRIGGTPGYIAPERLAGRAWDSRADLYGVGATLYRVLGGRRVTDRQQPAEALRDLREGRPGLAELRPDLPDALTSLVARLLAVDPGARPRHATEVVVHLGAAIGEALPVETPGTARCYALASLIVGREAPLGDLSRALLEVAGGTGTHLLALSGGPGLGKTRIGKEVAWRAETDGWRVASVECQERAAPAAPLLGFASQLGAGQADAAAGGERAAAALLETVKRPTLLVLDDAHRAADAVWHTLSVLTHDASRTGRPAAALLLFDAERLSPTARQWLALGASRGMRPVEIGPLPETAVGSVLRSLFGENVLSERTQQAIARRSGGNPLLLEEQVRELVETRVIRSTPSGWRPVDADLEETLPAASARATTASERLDSFLRRRIAGLEPDAQAVLEALAALGGRGREESLAAVSAPGTDARLGLSLLAGRSLVASGAASISLAHEALARLSLEALPPDRYREIHRRAAARLTADRADDSEVARALREAGERAGAFECFLRAGTRAKDAGEGRLCARWLEEALADAAAAQVDDERLTRALGLFGQACSTVGRLEDALVAFEQAFRRIPAGAVGERSRLVWLATTTAILTCDPAALVPWLRRGAEAARAGDRLAGARWEYSAACVATTEGRYRAAREHLGRARRQVDAGSELGLKVAIFTSGIESRFDTAALREVARASLLAAEEAGDSVAAGHANGNIACAEIILGAPGAALAILDKAIEACERAGNMMLHQFLLDTRAAAEHQRGEWNTAWTLAGGSPWRAQSALRTAMFLWHEGDLDRAGRQAKRALGTRTYAIVTELVMAAAAAAAAERRDTRELGDLCDRAEADARRAGTPLDALQARLVRAYREAMESPARGGAALRRVARSLDSAGYRADVPAILRDAACWLARGGDIPAARACFADARDRLMRLGCKPGVLRLDEIERRIASGGLADLFRARSLDDLARQVVRVGPHLGFRGELRLFADVDGAVRELGNVVAGSESGDAGLRSRAAAVLRSGKPARVGGTDLLPIRAGERAICLCAAGQGTPLSGKESLLPEMVAAALSLVGERGEVARSGGFERIPTVAAATQPTARARSKTARPSAPFTGRPAARAEAADTVVDAASRMLELSLGEVELRHPFPEVVGRGRAMTRALAILDRLADSDATVLITGETGTGKEVFARALHAAGRRMAGPFVACNCGAIPAPLFESEFFGYRRGAFTGAVRDHPGFALEASGGVLFLDEVGDLPLESQPKLLRLLQESRVRPVGTSEEVPVDLRIVAATHRDLAREVTEGRFRADLYYRLNVVEVRLPPLRERLADIPDLCRHILTRLGRPEQALGPAAMRLLLSYPWPGNVRELENEIERASLLADGQPVLPRHLTEKLKSSAAETTSAQRGSLFEEVRALERRLIKEALRRAGGRRTEAARALGISREWLRVKMSKFRLDR